MPSCSSGNPSLAFAVATRALQAMASSQPPPSATPVEHELPLTVGRVLPKESWLPCMHGHACRHAGAHREQLQQWAWGRPPASYRMRR